VKPSSDKQLEILFVPFDIQNPYQRELADGLVTRSVRVQSRMSLKGLVRRVLIRMDASDLIHLHWLPRVRASARGRLSFVAFLLRICVLKLFGRPIVWTVHNLYSHEMSWQRGEWLMARLVIACSSRVIAHSETARNLIAAEYRLPTPDKITVIPHGHYANCYPNTISIQESRSRLGLCSTDVVFLFLGHIRQYKGVPELIEAFQELPQSGASLVIAGKPFDQANMTEMREIASNNENIQIQARFIPDDEVQVFMNACDVVVFPYRDILTSGAVILAMSVGRACIAPAIGCIVDVLDEHGAILYDPDRPDGLRQALASAMTDGQRLQEMGAYNLQRARVWSWDGIAQQTAEVYREALR
jgi:glycosyltransferase involved in cell wall biosynthesis